MRHWGVGSDLLTSLRNSGTARRFRNASLGSDLLYSPHCATRVRLLGFGMRHWGPTYSPHCATRLRLAGFGMRLLLWYALLTAVLSPMGLRPPAEGVLCLR
jgi:hypothetical protein